MLLATKEPGLPTKAHTYTMFHILLHPTQNTRAHKKSWKKKLECRGCEEECCIPFIFTDGL
jgi:hypothetical protein